MANVLSSVLLVLVLLVLASRSQLTKDEIIRKSQKVRRLPIDECGKSSETVFDKKIINGEPASLGSYPWMAAIGYSLEGVGPYWNCGGSLITDQYVLTAAHCLDPSRTKSPQGTFKVYLVRLGDLDLDDSEADGATPVDMDVESTLFHQQYNNREKTNDIGLIRLKRRVIFTDFIKPICLPPPEFSENMFEGHIAVVTGWGVTSLITKAYKTRLSEAEVELKNLTDCRRNITSVMPRAVLNENVICAASPGKDSCQGDSGGPLMLYRRYRGKSRMFLLGIVSYGYKCAEANYPGVYARVSQYMAWVMDNLDI